MADELAAAQSQNVSDSEAQELHGIQARNLARLADAGMKISMEPTKKWINITMNKRINNSLLARI